MGVRGPNTRECGINGMNDFFFQIKLLDDLKNGTEKKGPQNSRIHAEGIMGRTSLKDLDPDQEVRFDRDFQAAKAEWVAQKEAERLEAEKKKAAAQQAAKK